MNFILKLMLPGSNLDEVSKTRWSADEKYFCIPVNRRD
jgi:hypothetical protein